MALSELNSTIDRYREIFADKLTARPEIKVDWYGLRSSLIGSIDFQNELEEFMNAARDAMSIGTQETEDEQDFDANALAEAPFPFSVKSISTWRIEMTHDKFEIRLCNFGHPEVDFWHPYLFDVKLPKWQWNDICLFVRTACLFADEMMTRYEELSGLNEAEIERVNAIREPFKSRRKALLSEAKARVESDLRATVSDLKAEYCCVWEQEISALGDLFVGDPEGIAKVSEDFDRDAESPTSIYNLGESRIRPVLEEDEGHDMSGMLDDLLNGKAARGWKMSENYIASITKMFWDEVNHQKRSIKHCRAKKMREIAASAPFTNPEGPMKDLVAYGYEYKRVDPYNSSHYDKHTFTSPCGRKVSICDMTRNSKEVSDYALKALPILFSVLGKVSATPKRVEVEDKGKGLKVMKLRKSTVTAYLLPISYEQHRNGGSYISGYRFSLGRNASEEEAKLLEKELKALDKISSGQWLLF